jgi:hypothetical protein
MVSRVIKGKKKQTGRRYEKEGSINAKSVRSIPSASSRMSKNTTKSKGSYYSKLFKKTDTSGIIKYMLKKQPYDEEFENGINTVRNQIYGEQVENFKTVLNDKNKIPHYSEIKATETTRELFPKIEKKMNKT